MDIKTILVVEDEPSINDILNIALTSEGYKVISSFSGKEAMEALKSDEIDLVLLDINLPDKSGFQICKDIIIQYKTAIIMLTARNDIVDKVLGLEFGADDYITKPFDIREVVTRIKVVLRRFEKVTIQKEESKNILIEKKIKINIDSRIVYKNGEEIKLKPKEYDLLLFLANNKNKVFTREQLLDKVWGFDYDGEIRTVDIHVRRIRAKLDENGQSIIETVFGVGYAFR
ncbi:MAG: response regulator transcription factor [Clostridiaceae bacterium]